MADALRVSTATALAIAGLVAIAGCRRAAASGETPQPISANTAQAPAGATSRDAADAKAFLDGLYGHYKTSKDNNFQPFDGNIKEVLDLDTIALMDADQTALKGELGDIDGDWLCDCQDFESITATVTVQSATPTSAKATSVFRDSQYADRPPGRDTFDLVKTPAGWRIHDMGTADQPSLRRVLTDEIARLKAGGKPASGPDEAP
jgi:hypothetical protein